MAMAALGTLSLQHKEGFIAMHSSLIKNKHRVPFARHSRVKAHWCNVTSFLLSAWCAQV